MTAQILRSRSWEVFGSPLCLSFIAGFYHPKRVRNVPVNNVGGNISKILARFMMHAASSLRFEFFEGVKSLRGSGAPGIQAGHPSGARDLTL